jgi:hypothetical protein
MKTYTVEINDDKSKLFNQLMEQLNFVRSVKDCTKKNDSKKKELEGALVNRGNVKALRNLIGVWKDSDITLAEIRNKTWKRNW